MKILLVNTYDQQGGAARATMRLFNGLKEKGEEMRMLVQNKDSSDPGIIQPGGCLARSFNFIRPYIDFTIPLPQVRKRILFSTSLLPGRVIQTIERINPDIVHLNWIAGGMIRIEALKRIRQPIVWTLHDLWAFTGGCHYPPAECNRYLLNCGCCPVLHSRRENDLSRSVFNRKQKVYDQIKKLYIVTPSRWLAGCVKASRLLGDRPVDVIPNGLDTAIFKPGDQTAARKCFNLPSDKKIILFGGIRCTLDEQKGFHLLLESLKRINVPDPELVVFGSSGSKAAADLPFRTRFLGYIPEEEKLAALYTASDVVVVPSYREVFGQTASEALSCGIPVAAFETTGLTDIVDHLENGYLARPFEPEDLANGIKWILEDKERYRQLSDKARTKVLSVFDIRVVAQSVTGLYSRILR